MNLSDDCDLTVFLANAPENPLRRTLARCELPVGHYPNKGR